MVEVLSSDPSVASCYLCAHWCSLVLIGAILAPGSPGPRNLVFADFEAPMPHRRARDLLAAATAFASTDSFLEALVDC